jgi:hypothetical protein
MSKREERAARLMPEGIPKYVRCYDNNGESLDRYTVVFTGKASGFMYVAMNAQPCHPSYGIYQHGEGSGSPIDYPTYGHLGKKIKFSDLPEDCRKAVVNEYKELWKLED